jgi:hypothetical protein
MRVSLKKMVFDLVRGFIHPLVVTSTLASAFRLIMSGSMEPLMSNLSIVKIFRLAMASDACLSFLSSRSSHSSLSDTVVEWDRCRYLRSIVSLARYCSLAAR